MVPARYASQRFPGKPLVALGGRPMVQWVHDAAVASGVFEAVVVATDDDRVAECVEGFGGTVERTSADHETGTDRVAETAQRHPWAEVVVNVQGDQPFVTTEMLEVLVEPYRRGDRPEMTTLACPFASTEQRLDPNSVKVVLDQRGAALYFSRAPIPHERVAVPDLPVYHHLGLYAFDAGFLATYAGLPATPFERCEALEQLRVLEHGHRILVGLVARPTIEINTPEDLAAAEASLAQRREAGT